MREKKRMNRTRSKVAPNMHPSGIGKPEGNELYSLISKVLFKRNEKL